MAVGGYIQRCTICEAWDASVEVTAAAFAVDPELLRAESRGRGPRPPRAAWMAKKMAVHLAIVLAGCDYIALARLLRLHKDTVSSHCAAIRDACAGDDDFEQLSLSLEVCARLRIDFGVRRAA